jgi:hypothetical protein
MATIYHIFSWISLLSTLGNNLQLSHRSSKSYLFINKGSLMDFLEASTLMMVVSQDSMASGDNVDDSIYFENADEGLPSLLLRISNDFYLLFPPTCYISFHQINSLIEKSR